MTNNAYLAALGYAYLGQLIAFTICQALLLRRGNRVPIFLWTIGSFFNAVAVIGAPNTVTIYSTEMLVLWSANAALAGGVFKFAALSFRTKSIARDRLSNAVIFISVLAMPVAVLPPLTPYRLLITSIIGFAISTACVRATYRNRYWASHNDYGRGLMLAGMVISVFGMAFRGLTSYPLGEDRIFAGDSNLQIWGLATLVVISLFLQIGFTGMLIARQDNEAKFADRRNVRAWQRSVLLTRRGQKLRVVAKQRLDLIQLLTHEVRQPINNAQAALQSITPDLYKVSSLSDSANHALERSKASLDGITRALSNVIVAGTLVADAQNWSRQQIASNELLEMVLLDCSSANRKRVVVAPLDDHIFIECVPTLARVALHNILEHVLGLADADENISVSVTVDDVRLGVAFTISGNMKQQKMDEADVLSGLRVTGGASPHMTSFGLLVAKLVAQNHLGECSIETDCFGVMKIIFFVPQ